MKKEKIVCVPRRAYPLKNGRARRSGFLLLNRIAWLTTILIDWPSPGLVCLCVKQSRFGSRLRSRKSLQAMALDRPDFLESKASEWMNEIRWMKKSLWLKQLADQKSSMSARPRWLPGGSLRDTIGIGLSKWPISRCMYSWSAFLIVPFPGIDWEGGRRSGVKTRFHIYLLIAG